MEVISIVIEYDAHQFSGDFVSMDAAREWIVGTLARLIDEFGVLPSSLIRVRRR